MSAQGRRLIKALLVLVVVGLLGPLFVSTSYASGVVFVGPGETKTFGLLGQRITVQMSLLNGGHKAVINHVETELPYTASSGFEATWKIPPFGSSDVVKIRVDTGAWILMPAGTPPAQSAAEACKTHRGWSRYEGAAWFVKGSTRIWINETSKLTHYTFGDGVYHPLKYSKTDKGCSQAPIPGHAGIVVQIGPSGAGVWTENGGGWFREP